jgi:hypothetical protein
LSSTVNVNIPSPIDISSTMSGSLDLGLDNIKIAPLVTNSNMAIAPISTDSKMAMSSSLAITEIPPINIGITELPTIRLEFGMKPTRVHFPTNMKFTVCAFGKEMLSFGVCGESMIVIEDYHPHQREQCT